MRLRPLFTLAAFALDEIFVLFNKAYPAGQVETLCGSSGKFQTRIRQGAPFDMIEGAYLESDPEQCKAFRPAHAKPR